MELRVKIDLIFFILVVGGENLVGLVWVSYFAFLIRLFLVRVWVGGVIKEGLFLGKEDFSGF